MTASTIVRPSRLRTAQALHYFLGQVPLSQSIAGDGLVTAFTWQITSLAIPCFMLPQAFTLAALRSIRHASPLVDVLFLFCWPLDCSSCSSVYVSDG
jgi:hypothetical protein